MWVKGWDCKMTAIVLLAFLSAAFFPINCLNFLNHRSQTIAMAANFSNGWICQWLSTPLIRLPNISICLNCTLGLLITSCSYWNLPKPQRNSRNMRDRKKKKMWDLFSWFGLGQLGNLVINGVPSVFLLSLWLFSYFVSSSTVWLSSYLNITMTYYLKATSSGWYCIRKILKSSRSTTVLGLSLTPKREWVIIMREMGQS